MRYSKIVMATGVAILGLTAMVGSLPADAKTKQPVQIVDVICTKIFKKIK